MCDSMQRKSYGAWPTGALMVALLLAGFNASATLADQDATTDPRGGDVAVRADGEVKAPVLGELIAFFSEGPVEVIGVSDYGQDRKRPQNDVALEVVGSLVLAGGVVLESGEPLFPGDSIKAGMFINTGPGPLELSGPEGMFELQAGEAAHVGGSGSDFFQYMGTCVCGCRENVEGLMVFCGRPHYPLTGPSQQRVRDCYATTALGSTATFFEMRCPRVRECPLDCEALVGADLPTGSPPSWGSACEIQECASGPS